MTGNEDICRQMNLDCVFGLQAISKFTPLGLFILSKFDNEEVQNELSPKVDF